ncbi:MAG: diguanylate cyclase [Myxococcota bacterium]
MKYSVLVADDDPPSRRLLKEALVAEGFDVELARDGDEAWNLLDREGSPQIAILDWCMPGMDGVDVVRKVRARGESRYTYILMLSALSDQEHVRLGLSSGADGYVSKPFDLAELIERVRAGCRMVGREGALHHAQAELKAEHESQSAQLAALSVTDELTGLHNRRGFVNLADQHSRLALRRRESFSIAFMDLDGLKAINDRLGHHAGDEALRAVAEVLKATLRECDIIARLGGDEFVALLGCPPEQVALVFERLAQALEKLDSASDRPYRLSLSMGAESFNPDKPSSVEQMLAAADRKMYAEKRARKSRGVSVLAGSLDQALDHGSLPPPSGSGGLSSTSSAQKSLLRLPAGKAGDLMAHLLNAWSVRRPDGFAHAQRLATYANILARALGGSPEEAERLAHLAALHDIGEIGLPDTVLFSTGELSLQDKALKRRHASLGRELLCAAPGPYGQMASTVACHHHERWDGSGYPDGLIAEACPRDARIVGILDAYDNLMHSHSGEKRLENDAVREYFLRQRGRYFEPRLVDVLLDTLPDLSAIQTP